MKLKPMTLDRAIDIAEVILHENEDRKSVRFDRLTHTEASALSTILETVRKERESNEGEKT